MSTPCLDIHAHFIPAEFVAAFRTGSGPAGFRAEPSAHGEWLVDRSGGRSALSPELYDLEARLGYMDRFGVDVGLMTVSPALYCYTLEASEAVDLARRINDEIADLVAQADGRIVGVAHLPMQDTDAAVAEAERAVETLGLRGAQMAPMIVDRGLDDADHLPVLACLERLDVPVILHPDRLSMDARSGLERYYLANLVGNPYQTVVGAARLILGGVLDELPALRPVLVHGGGYLPYQIGRLDRGHAVRPEAAAAAKPPSAYLRRFLYDTLTHSPQALRFLVDLVGADRVAYGTDLPYDMGGGSLADHLGSVALAPDDEARVRGGNAKAWFGVG